MKKNKGLKNNSRFPYIRRELKKLYGKEKTKQIVSLAEVHYDGCVQICTDATPGEWTHLQNTILPTVSFYKALLETDPENALTCVQDILLGLCQKGGAAMGKLLRLPCMRSVFMWLLPKMADKMFGESCGFGTANREVTKRMLKMDMTACPYCKYAELLRCRELMPLFCESDFATYGNLPGIQFERTETLGTGGKRCDFKFYHTDR